MCNKHAYPDKKTAITAKNYFNNGHTRAKIRGGEKLFVYPCRKCKKWHLTSKRQGKRYD